MNDYERNEALLGGVRALDWIVELRVLTTLFEKGEINIEVFATKSYELIRYAHRSIGNGPEMLSGRLASIRNGKQ